MECKEKYDEMMSRKLDGLLMSEEERQLDRHIEGCGECALLWAAMQEADRFMWESVAMPLPVPQVLYSRVMVEVRASPSPALLPLAPPHPSLSLPMRGLTRPLIPSLTRPLSDDGSLFLSPGEWHGQVASYVRGMAAIGVSVIGTLLLLLALVLWGVIPVEGEAANTVDVVRAFLSAGGTWMRSFFGGVGPASAVVAAGVFGLLALGGWQMIVAYQRTLADQRGNTGYLEALT